MLPTPRLLRLALALVVLLLVGASPARADAYGDVAVQAWAAGDPVFVSSDSGALSTEAAARLRGRIEGWRSDVHVAVLPALALSAWPGGDDPARAVAMLDSLADQLGEDGIYLVNLSGRGTYGAGYGDAADADAVGRILAGEVDGHTLGQVAQVLDGTLDGLGAPGASSDGGGPDGPGWWLWVLVGAAVLAGLAAAYVWSRRRTSRRARSGAGGETWAGPADYRPTFAVQTDEQDTTEERAALAREDVTRLGEELDRADLPVTDPAVAAHVQAALDAYADASRRVDSLTTDPELRQVGEVAEYARWQLACARARLAEEPLPPRRVPCFIDAAHGVSVADAAWAPPGGVLRPVPVCRACLDRLSGGTP